MAFLKRSLGAKLVVLFALIPMLILSACGSSGGSGGSGGSSPPSQAHNCKFLFI